MLILTTAIPESLKTTVRSYTVGLHRTQYDRLSQQQLGFFTREWHVPILPTPEGEGDAHANNRMFSTFTSTKNH